MNFSFQLCWRSGSFGCGFWFVFIATTYHIEISIGICSQISFPCGQGVVALNIMLIFVSQEFREMQLAIGFSCLKSDLSFSNLTSWKWI